MSERPRFDKRKLEFVKTSCFNELIDMYNDLADAYEELYVKDVMRTESIQMMDGRSIAVLGSLAEGHDEKVKEIGYDIYKKSVLSGERKSIC